MKIVFAGTPDFAKQHLEMVLDSKHEIIGVLTQPDRRSGRGKKLQSSAVKDLALRKGLLVMQPEVLKNDETVKRLTDLNPDIILVVAYGLLVPTDILNIPKLGCINVHASLLPRWRGASPMEYAILNGDKEIGVSYMKMSEGLDEGPVYEMHATDLTENDDLKIKLEQSLDARALELENAIRILEIQLKAMRLVNEQLDKENSQYAIIKSAVDTNQVDLLMDLSHKVIDKTLENRQLKIENKLMTDSLKNVKNNFENLELELFQKVIDKKIEEQQFIDSILVKFCKVDSLLNQNKPFLKDSLIRTDSLLIETPKTQSE